MRTLRLAQAAAEAEGLRLRHRAQRAARRAVLLAVALAFLAAAVLLAHLAAWLFLSPVYGPPATALGLALCDLGIAAVLALLALRSRPGTTEREAALIRDQAWQGARQSLDLWAVAIAIGQILARRKSPKA
jgi:hypothetical protein